MFQSAAFGDWVLRETSGNLTGQRMSEQHRRYDQNRTQGHRGPEAPTPLTSTLASTLSSIEVSVFSMKER